MLSVSSFPRLSTERLQLRKLEISDAEQIFSLRSNEIVNRYLGRTPANSVKDAEAFIKRINSAEPGNQTFYWAICFHNEPDLVGTICLWNFSEKENKSEIGYELLPQFQGQGIMQEAFLAVLKFAFEVLQLNTIEAWTVAQNENSVKILKRNGFKRNIELENKIDLAIKTPDDVIFCLTKKEYLDQGL
jgi:ribosomal-protein-alanine N-acetyltransferase